MTKKSSIFFFAIAIVGLLAGFPAGATTLSDLNCAANQIPKFISGKWVCRADSVSPVLIDANGKVVGQIVRMHRRFAQFTITVTDTKGRRRSVNLEATPVSFYTDELNGVYFDQPMCVGNPYFGAGEVMEDPGFSALGELAFVTNEFLPPPQTQGLYITVLGAGVVQAQIASSLQGGRCQEFGGLQSLDVVPAELAVPDLQSVFRLPLNVRR